MAEDTPNSCQDIELKIDPDPFFTSCQISSINEKKWAPKLIETKATFQMGFYGYFSATSPFVLQVKLFF